ncbi:hypothetical protein WME95_17710 [Sorangium sp. So ce327]|uniref:radical SAM protein n=1 Tax=Sorangium sp. So ce327 TaxID=3133301 RepID=UPI003F60C3A4
MTELVSLARPSRARLRRGIQQYMRGLRDDARRARAAELRPDDFDRLLFTDPRKGHLDGECVDRLVLFLRGTGCAWVSQGGGCTFCGFWDATRFGERVTDEQYRKQVEAAVDAEGARIARYPIVCLYNDGSLIDEAEIGRGAVTTIVRRIAELPTVRRVVIEAKVSDLREDLVRELVDAAAPKQIEIAVGFESANADVRDLCVNKSFSLRQFEQKSALVKSLGAQLVPLVMVKPPFLTEAQAIEDVVSTLQFLEGLGLPRVDLEMATVEAHTLVQDLYRHGLYQPPRLWSVIAVVERSRTLGLTTPVYISPPNYSVPSLAHAANCRECTPAVVRAIEAYNHRFDASSFGSLGCACRADWLAEIATVAALGDLEEQVQRIFDHLVALSPARAAAEPP